MADTPPPAYTETQEIHPEHQQQQQQYVEPEDTTRKRDLLRINTPSWIYPFYGIYYFATHRFLHPLMRARLLPCFILSAIVFITLFLLTYLPQVAFLALFHGFNASAWVNGTFLVLGEAAVVIALLFEAFFVDETLVDIFDAVLVHEGLAELVANGREVSPGGNNEPTLDSRRRLGKPLPGFGRVYSPFSLRQILEFVFFLPFNFIPWVGVPLFLLVTGLRAGPLQHWRYFKFLGLDKARRKVFERRMSASYTWFGTAHLALQLIPGFSMLFLMTTAAGSALWVVNLERRKRQAAGAQQRDAEHDSYVDNPV